MNLPGHYVHHISGGFGRLVAPWPGGRWLIWFDGGVKSGLHVMDSFFHNCTATGVY